MSKRKQRDDESVAKNQPPVTAVTPGTETRQSRRDARQLDFTNLLNPSDDEDTNHSPDVKQNRSREKSLAEMYNEAKVGFYLTPEHLVDLIKSSS